MASQQERLAALDQKVNDIKEDVAEIKDTLKTQDKKWEDRMDKMESRFASKWVETASKVVGGAVVVGFFGGLFYWLFAIVFSK